MSGVGLEVLLEGLIPEIAYSGEQGEFATPGPLCLCCMRFALRILSHARRVIFPTARVAALGDVCILLKLWRFCFFCHKAHGPGALQVQPCDWPQGMMLRGCRQSEDKANMVRQGIPISELLKIVRQYHLSLVPRQDATMLGDSPTGLPGPCEPANLEESLSEAEMASARWAWDWLRSRPQILINGNKRWNRLELSEALALPEIGTADGADAAASEAASSSVAACQQVKGNKPKKALRTRPRIHPSEDLVWQTLTRHGVDYKRVPALEWACLQGIATARAEGILQSDLRRLVDQDKRSLPKRTDSLARKGYIAKRTVVVQKMKTSRLWLIDFAPPLVEEETCGLDLSPETLSKDTDPVPWHQRWTGNNIDMDALGRTVVGVVKAWTVIRYSDLRSKMGVSGKRWQMKTLAKNCQRLVDMGVFKYTAASFPGSSRKVFKDCLKFVREPSAEEWDKFLATGKKTSQYSDPTRHRVPKPNALALYGKSTDEGQKNGDDRSKLKRIFSGWAPEKPIAQSVFEVIRSAGPEGASNPQVSVATVGYQHRRYLSSYLTKVAETKQPPHLKKFQVVSKLVRTGKTSAYMFSAPGADSVADRAAESKADGESGLSDCASTSLYGFGSVRPKAFFEGQDISLSALSQLARKSRPFSRRKLQAVARLKKTTETDLAPETASELDVNMVDQGEHSFEIEPSQYPKRSFDRAFGNDGVVEDEMAGPTQNAQKAVEEPASAFIGIPYSLDQEPRRRGGPRKSLVVTFKSEKLKEPRNHQASTPAIAFTPVNHVNRIPVDTTAGPKNEDPVLTVRYHGVAGKLRLSHPDRTLYFVRSGRGFKKPVAIPIDDNIEDVALRDVPGGDGKSLVLVMATRDDASPQDHSFIFDNDGSENGDMAGTVQREVMKMKALGSPRREPIPVANEQPAAQDEMSVDPAPARSGPTRGTGRGRGGARGRTRRGQAPSGGGKPYVCATCGGSWKNDIGLKYHLEKAQVPCNPNFDPASVLERSRKRRKLSPPPPASSANSEAGDEETTSRSRRARGTRKSLKDATRPPLKIRAALRSAQGGAQRFRGLDLTDDHPVEVLPDRVPERFRRTSSVALARPVKATTDGGLGLGVGNGVFNAEYFIGKGVGTPSKSNARPSTPIGTMPFAEPTINAEGDASQATPVVKEVATMISLADHNQSQPLTPLPTPGAVPTKAPTSQILDDVPQATYAPGNTPSSHEPTDEFSLRRGGRIPVPDEHWSASPSMGVFPATGQSELPQNGYPELPPEGSGAWPSREELVDREQPATRPFVPSSNYARMATDAKRRTAQAFDIINHLLDNTCGVFPGDKALFYALTKVFLNEFRDQMPPTWKNCHSAVKALETRKLATLHTHMLKTERGRLQTCTLLIRTGVDPAGMIPTIMKQKMREAYPGIYIPPAFSPTQEELALLQELDKKPPSPEKETKPNANGQKFRSRRKIDDIEVFNAPYYTQSAPAVGAKKDPLWIWESERRLGDSFSSRKRPAVNESSPVGPFLKRARTGLQGTPTGLRSSGFENQYEDDIPVDPEIMGSVFDQTSPSHGRSRQGDASLQEDDYEELGEGSPSSKKPGSDVRRKSRISSAVLDDGSAAWDRDPPSVVEAIRAYSLLPSMGPRRTRRLSITSKTLGKLPPELGRLRNPGLTSLPVSFFGNVKRGAATQPILADVQFLDPNTHLDSDAEESRDSQGKLRSLTPMSNEDSPEETRVEGSDTASETRPEEPKKFRFVLPSVLKDLPNGSWSTLGTAFFEHYDTSFTLDGRMPSRRWFLAQNLPSTAEEMAQGQEVGKTRVHLWVDKQYGKFCSLVNRCAAWEQSQTGSALMKGGTMAPGYIFINLSPPRLRANTKSVNLKWSDETQFSLETLAYEDLEEDEYDDVVFVDDSPEEAADRGTEQPLKKRRIPRAEGVQVRRAQGRPPKLKLQATKTMREHTAYPKTADDFLRVPDDENEDLDWLSENVRLTAFIVVTTLLGGVDRVVDWGLMLRLMPDQT